MAAQTSAASNTQRRPAMIRRRALAAFMAPAPAVSRRARCHHAASTAGLASAVRAIRPASHHDSQEAGPGVTRTPAPTAAAAAGRTTTALPARATEATCRSEAPRARIMVNSPRRCSATSRAPSSTITAAMTARLTSSSESTRCTASSVATNDWSTGTRPLLRLITVVEPSPAVVLM